MLRIIGAVALWAVIHSLLASHAAKRFFRQAFGEAEVRLYRILYNVAALGTFAVLVWLARSLPDRTLYLIHAPWLYLMLAAEALASIGLLASVFQIDVFAFIGLRQIVGADKTSGLVTGGLYHYVRHPIYLFTLLLIWLTPVMTINILALLVALTMYIFIGAYFEEKKLLAEFGSAYADYRCRTPMIIPFLK